MVAERAADLIKHEEALPPSDVLSSIKSGWKEKQR
jgi:hypothetical protein